MAYLTPEIAPTTSRCWRLSIPVDEQFLGAILGQLLELTYPHNWEETTGISVAATIVLAQDLFDEFSIGSFCMIGSLVHYVTNSPPHGVLDCDGTQYLRVDYPDLYADLPASLIVDANNFIVPTIEDVFMLSAGSTYSPEDTGGTVDHQLTTSELPAHTHLYDKPTQALDLYGAGPPDPTRIGIPFIPTVSGSSGSDTAHENMPPFIAYKVGIVAK